MSNAPSVWLMKRGKRYLLRWAGTGTTDTGNAKYVTKSLGRCTKADGEVARRAKIVELGGGASPDRPDKITLDEFSAVYLQRRTRSENAGPTEGKWHKKYPKIAPATATNHDMTLRYLVEHFGGGRVVDSIRADEAGGFLDALAAGELIGARTSTQTYTLSEHAIRQNIRNAKTIFGWAKTVGGMVTANPFDGFVGTSLPGKPKHHVTPQELQALLDAAPSAGWRALFALCRLAGLRRDEARTLVWSGSAVDDYGETRDVGVDLFARRIRLVSTKTHLYRVVPIVPQLHQLLIEARGEDQDTVTGLSANNLTRNAEVIAQAAGMVPWRKFYQSMRTTCENEWKEQGVAVDTYAKWLGHSTEVAGKHYTAPTAAEFDAVTKVA